MRSIRQCRNVVYTPSDVLTGIIRESVGEEIIFSQLEGFREGCD